MLLVNKFTVALYICYALGLSKSIFYYSDVKSIFSSIADHGVVQRQQWTTILNWSNSKCWLRACCFKWYWVLTKCSVVHIMLLFYLQWKVLQITIRASVFWREISVIFVHSLYYWGMQERTIFFLKILCGSILRDKKNRKLSFCILKLI